MALKRVPTTTEFVAAVRLIEPTDGEKVMLNFHSDNPSSTFDQIGEAAGHKGANLLYGALAHKLGDAIPGFEFDTYLNGGDWYSSSIGTMDTTEPRPHVLVIHESLANAIGILRKKREL